MTTFDLQANMIPSQYGEQDQWKSADQYDAARGNVEWVEVRCHAKYTRRVERFSVGYVGPNGKARLVYQGPEVAGPTGYLVPQCSVIANTPVARARYIDAQVGDTLIMPGGQRMVIVEDSPRTNYPRLVAEVEAGLNAAIDTVRAHLNEASADLRADADEIDKVKAAARYALLQELWTELRDLAEPLRTQYAADQ